MWNHIKYRLVADLESNESIHCLAKTVEGVFLWTHILCLLVALNRKWDHVFLSSKNKLWDLKSMLSENSHRSVRDFILEVVIHRTQTKIGGERGSGGWVNNDWPLAAGRRLCICPDPVCWRARGGQSLWKSCLGYSHCFLSARKCSPCNCCCWDSVPLKGKRETGLKCKCPERTRFN